MKTKKSVGKIIVEVFAEETDDFEQARAEITSNLDYDNIDYKVWTERNELWALKILTSCYSHSLI